MTSRSKSILKYIFAFTLLAFIIRHAGAEKIAGFLRQISPLNCFFAIVSITFAQIIAALRMRFFFRRSGFPLNTYYAVILFYVGAFYNFLLPGGIGGDAYKVMLARKRMDMKTMQGIKIMIADRASGLCIVMMILFFALYRIDFSHSIPYAGLWIILATIITLISYVVFSKLLVKQSATTMLGSLPYSLVSQLCWVIAVIIILQSLTGDQHIIVYVGFYAAASIASLIPISVGGLGIKETTYYYGALVLQHFAGITVNPDIGIALSLCMFAMTFISSLPGLFWLEKVERTRHYH